MSFIEDEFFYSEFFNDQSFNNVKRLWNGELVTTSGVHLGHVNQNFWDSLGDRYIVNLMSISGIQANTGNATLADTFGKDFRNTETCFNRRLCP